MHARLAPEQGAIIAKALQAAMGDVPPEISAEIYRDTATQREPAYPANAKRADALEKLAESYLAGKKEALNGGDKYLIEIHTTADTLAEEGETAESQLKRGEISAETSRRLACDASVVEITEDQHGIPLDVGRKTRTIPPAIRRALKNRDGRIVPPTADQNLRGDFREIVDYNNRSALGIGPNTLTPWWYGEKIDYNMPIQSMLYREEGRKPPV